MRKKTLLALLLVASMVLAACGGSGGGTGSGSGSSGTGRAAYVAPELVTTLPRNESLYFGGLGWSPIAGWSPLMGSTSNWANDQNAGGARTMVYETPYMYNGLTDTFHPLLADGDFTWNADYSELTFKIKAAAYWSDGTKVTAHDVQATWETKLNYTIGAQAGWLPYVSGVEARDDETVVVKSTMTADGRPAFYKMVETYVAQDYVLQKAWLEKLVERNNGDPAAIDIDPGEDFVWSGPYTKYFEDDSRAVLIRDDGYWGQHASMWGKLPAPKYLVNTILNDNMAIVAAMQAGEIDVSQSYIPNVNLLWEEQGLPVSTFFDGPPYNLSANMPTVWFNLRDGAHPALQEVALRKAIAIAVDYDAVVANAMTYQSPTFSSVPRSLFAPAPGEQALYDQAAVAHLQWAGNDIAGAIALLDAAGIVDSDGDGWREYNGEKISFNAVCPYGWNDWEASLEIVADAGSKIGIEITTYFPQESEFYDNIPTDPTSTAFDIFMMWTGSFSPTGAWSRIRNLLSSEWIGREHNWSGNWNHYSNPRVDQLIQDLPLELDAAKQKEMYTELVEIYLTDVPSFSVMYRPDKFHTVYEGVWTGFTEQGDGRNVPPFNCLSGYAIADLFNLRLVD